MYYQEGGCEGAQPRLVPEVPCPRDERMIFERKDIIQTHVETGAHCHYLTGSNLGGFGC